MELPVYFGNRNWEPYVEDTVAAMRDNGIRRAAVFTTSAWGGYSSCTQYNEDIARGRKPRLEIDAPELVKLRQYFDHPLFVEMFADAIARRRATLPESVRDDARLVFTAHSIPLRRRLAVRTGSLRAPGRLRVRAWSPRRPATTSTTRCGSRGRVLRRCRGWNPTSANT